MALQFSVKESLISSEQSQMDRIMIIDRDHTYIAAVKSLLPQYEGSNIPSLWLLISDKLTSPIECAGVLLNTISASSREQEHKSYLMRPHEDPSPTYADPSPNS